MFFKYTKLLSIIFLLLSCENEEYSIEQHSLTQIEIFFKKIKGGNYQTALKDLLLSNKDIDFTDSSTSALNRQFEDINLYSGKYVDSKLLRKRIVENDISIFAYLVKYQKKFYRFIFIFYKAENQVKIYKFAFDDAMDTELEESLKLYLK